MLPPRPRTLFLSCSFHFNFLPSSSRHLVRPCARCVLLLLFISFGWLVGQCALWHAMRCHGIIGHLLAQPLHVRVPFLIWFLTTAPKKKQQKKTEPSQFKLVCAHRFTHRHRVDGATVRDGCYVDDDDDGDHTCNTNTPRCRQPTLYSSRNACNAICQTERPRPRPKRCGLSVMDIINISASYSFRLFRFLLCCFFFSISIQRKLHE